MNHFNLRHLAWATGLTFTLALCGCSAVSLAASVVEAAVDVTSAVVVTGVKATGKVVGAAVDAVSPDKTAAPAAAVVPMTTPSPASAPTN
jgi:hypothetical protein